MCYSALSVNPCFVGKSKILLIPSGVGRLFYIVYVIIHACFEHGRHQQLYSIVNTVN